MSKTSATTTNPTPGETGDQVVPSATDEVEISTAVVTETAPAERLPARTKPAPVATEPEHAVERTFTQADLDRIVAERLAKVRNQYADYDDLRAAAEKLGKLEADIEKVKGQASSAANEAARLRLETAIVAAAARIGFADPQDAARLIDAGALKVEGDTVPGLTEALTALAEAKPYLVRKNAPPLAAANPSRDAAQPAGRTDQERRAEYFGGGASGFWTGRGTTISTRGQD